MSFSKKIDQKNFQQPDKGDDNADDDDEEEDYMSAAFVDEKSNPKTSLLWSRKTQVEHERYKKKLLNAPKSKRALAEIEHELRETGLDKPIEAGNKGFLLLQKMMSKSSGGAGGDNISSKTLASTSGSVSSESDASNAKITELISERAPIKVDLKTGRGGLGHASSAPKRFKPSVKISDKPEDINRRFHQNESEFREHQRKTKLADLARKDFFTCQRACANLDSEAGQTELPKVEWYWPPKLVEALKKKLNPTAVDGDQETAEVCEDDESSEEEEIDFEERLHELNDYLRNHYHYCIWCGVHYDSNDDLEDNCPGGTRDVHD